MNMALAISCVIVAICTWCGYKKGALRMIYGIAAWIFVAALLLFGTSRVENYLLDNTSIYEVINARVETHLGNQWDEAQNEILTGMREEGAGFTLEVPEYLTANNNITAAVKGIYENVSASLGSLSQENEFAWREQVDASLSEVKERTVSAMAGSVTSEIIHVISVVLVIAAGIAAIIVLYFIVEALSKNKVTGTISQWSGLAVGFVFGLVLLQIVFGCIHAMDFTEWGSKALYQIENTPLLYYFDQLNLFKYVLD